MAFFIAGGVVWCDVCRKARLPVHLAIPAMPPFDGRGVSPSTKTWALKPFTVLLDQ